MNLKLKVIARSSNTNSFGLREHVIVASNGFGFKACRSAYVPDADRFKENTELTLSLNHDKPELVSPKQIELAVLTHFSRLGFELVRRLDKDCPAKVLKEIFA